MKAAVRILLPVLVLALSACGDGNVFSLEVGDCFDDDSSFESGEVSDVPIVECSEPHDNEVYYTYDLPDGSFPGMSAVQETAFDDCLAEFEDFVGREYETSRYDIFPITPTADSWDAGDREVICALYDLDLAELTGTARNSGE